MNHRNGFNPLSRTTAHRRAMSRNMVTSLFRFERITTTKSKALEVRKAAEKLITRAKVDSVHNRREAAKFIADEKVSIEKDYEMKELKQKIEELIESYLTQQDL